MINITQLKAYLAAYPEAPERTTALEQRIQIGSGFHGKWYRSQREHMLGWMVVQECQERNKGNDPLMIDAKGMWGRLKCSPAMFWLADCARVNEDLLDLAADLAAGAARINPQDGDPHGRIMRTALPWAVLEQAILLGPKPTSTERAKDAGAAAFERLADMVSTYRPLRKWLL